MAFVNEAVETKQSDDVSSLEAFKIFAKVVLVMLLLAGLFRSIAPVPLKVPPTATKAPTAFSSFREEANHFYRLLKCSEGKITPADAHSGALYGCLKGNDELAKFWINETIGRPGEVENIKVMWNNPNGGVRFWLPHSDEQTAGEMLRTVVNDKVPTLKNELVDAFFGKGGQTFTTVLYDIEYRWTPGPGIDEHLLILSARR
ncbi:MAG: hypothetical protein ABL897_03040 [Hyphomicrobium sp.]